MLVEPDAADDGVVPDSVAVDELGVMIANGVTAARLMIGTPQHLALRRDVATGRVLGPQLWAAGPQVTGRRSATTAGAACLAAAPVATAATAASTMAQAGSIAAARAD